MSEKITLPGALRWMRDQFAGWLASVTVFSFLWLAVGVAVAVLFVWDGVWSRHQAPSNLDPLTFQGAGWVMRLWTVFALAGAVWCFRHGARIPGAVMAFTWVLTSLMTYGHALGFIATGQQERYATASAVVNVETVAVTSAEQQIATLEKQKDGIRADRDADVARFEAAINNITSDGLDNDELADVYRQDIANTQASARTRIEAIDAQILTILNSKQEARTTAASNTENVVKFDPLYILLAEWTDGKPGQPSDDYIRKIAQGIGAFWAALLEMIGGAGPALLYAIHAHAADRKREPAEIYSDDVPEGHVRVEIPEDEYERREKVWQEHLKRSEAAKLKAKIPIGNREWIKEKKKQIASLHESGASAQEIYEETKFGSYNEFEAFVNRIFNAKAAARILGVATPEEPDPRAAVPPAAVSEPEQQGEPDPDLEIPDEPKEYPVDFPKNDKPNGADHEQA